MRRCEVKNSEEPPAEIVIRLRRLVFDGLPLQLLVAVERIKFALEFFRVGELAAGFENLLLRAPRSRFRADGLRRSACAICGGSVAVYSSRRFRDLHPGHEAFEIALLLWFEITRHGSSVPSSPPCRGVFECYSAGTPVGVGAMTLPAGDQFEAEQHDGDQADREDQRAD